MVFARRRLALYTLGALLLCLVFRPMQYLGPMLRGSCGEAAHMVIVVPGGGLEGDGDIPPHTKVYGIMWHHVTALRRSCAGYTRGVGARAAPSYIRTSYVHTSTTPPPHLQHVNTPTHTPKLRAEKAYEVLQQCSPAGACIIATLSSGTTHKPAPKDVRGFPISEVTTDE